MPNAARLPILYALAWMLLIFVMSSVPGTVRPEDEEYYRVFLWLPPDVQNVLHVPVFGFLAWLWQRALSLVLATPRRADWGALAIAIGYGVVDEWHQTFVPGRYGSFTDLALDGIGALVAIQIGRWLRERRSCRSVPRE